MQLSKDGQLSFSNRTVLTFARHEEGEVTTLAILRIEHEKPLSKAEVEEFLIGAITGWVASTESGRAAWKESYEDFNVGDFSHHLEDPDLARQLHSHGLLIRSLETVDVGTAQLYDQVLVDSDKIA